MEVQEALDIIEKELDKAISNNTNASQPEVIKMAFTQIRLASGIGNSMVKIFIKTFDGAIVKRKRKKRRTNGQSKE
jgi:hypothetical protein